MPPRRTVIHAPAVLAVVALAVAATSIAASPPAPSPLPAAPQVVLTGHAGPGIGVYLSDLDGPDRRWIFSDIPSNTVHRPDWSPDGRRIAVEVMGDADYPPTSIWIGDADGTGAHEVGRCPALPCLQLGMPAWSPDGSSLAVARYDIEPDGVTWGPTSIAVLDLATGDLRTVAATADGATAYLYPRWSPDGRSLVAELDTYDGPGETVTTGSSIVIVDATGPTSQSPRPVTPMDGFGAHPDWSPDGMRIVYSTYGIESFETGAPGPANLFTIAPDGSGIQQVTQYPAGGSRAGHASWTPDGSQIIFTRIDGTDYQGFGERRVSFIHPDGTGTRSIEGYLGTFPRLQPIP